MILISTDKELVIDSKTVYINENEICCQDANGDEWTLAKYTCHAEAQEEFDCYIECLTEGCKTYQFLDGYDTERDYYEDKLAYYEKELSLMLKLNSNADKIKRTELLIAGLKSVISRCK